MKYILSLVLLVLSTFCLGQTTDPSTLLDANGNLILKRPVTVIDGLSDNNIVFSYRSAYLTNSDNNLIFGENSSLTNVRGSRINTTDGIFKNASYISADGDANRAMGETNFTRGFGNLNVGNFTFIDGNYNKLGESRWNSTSAQLFNSSARGTALIVNTSETHVFGDNGTAPGKGWGYVYNNNVRFWVYSDGRISLNGLLWPTTVPNIGDQLTYAGNGQLAWTAPTGRIAATTSVRPVSKIQRVAIYNSAGQLEGWATFQLK